MAIPDARSYVEKLEDEIKTLEYKEEDVEELKEVIVGTLERSELIATQLEKTVAGKEKYIIQLERSIV